MYSLNNIDIKQFLSQYWQKKPLVIKQGFADFIDPLDENDLAGLSQEPSVDSRIVSKTLAVKLSEFLYVFIPVCFYH